MILKYISKHNDEISYFEPTIDNPYMNYVLNKTDQINTEINAKTFDQINNQINDNENNDKKIKKLFRQDLYTDINDIWGKNLNDRNYYTMPNTNIVNNQTEFAKWCYNIENSGQCKILGTNCLR